MEGRRELRKGARTRSDASVRTPSVSESRLRRHFRRRNEDGFGGDGFGARGFGRPPCCVTIALGGVHGGAQSPFARLPAPFHDHLLPLPRTSAVRRRGAERREPTQHRLEAEGTLTGGVSSPRKEMVESRGNYERSALGARLPAAFLMIFPPKPRVERGGTAT